VLAKLAVPAWLLAALLVANGCDDGTAHRRLVRGGDVVRAFKTDGIVLQNTHLFGDEDAITAAYFAATPEVAKVRLFVAVCRSEATARDLARRPGSPLSTTATVKRRKNVVLYLAPDVDARSRRGALEALASL
jgi:hypothetical protein